MMYSEILDYHNIDTPEGELGKGLSVEQAQAVNGQAVQ